MPEVRCAEWRRGDVNQRRVVLCARGLQFEAEFAQECLESGGIVGLDFDFAVGDGPPASEFPFDGGA